MSGIRWTEDEYADYLAKSDQTPYNRSAISITHVESTVSNEQVGAEKGARLVTPVRIFCHTITNRLGDCDGRSLKAVLDGIVKAGILPDDSAQCVQEVRFTQELGKEDQTIITIETI